MQLLETKTLHDKWAGIYDNHDQGYGNKDSKDGGSSSGNIIKKINNDIVIKSGKYGAYISYKNKENIKIYSKKKTEDLTLEDCNAIIKNYRDYKSKKK